MSNESQNKLARRIDDKRAEVPLQWNESGAAKGGITSLEGLTRYDLAFTGSMQARDDGDYVKFADVERLLAAQAAPASPEQVQAEPLTEEYIYALWSQSYTEAIEAAGVCIGNGDVAHMNHPIYFARAIERYLAAPIAAAPAAEEVQWISVDDGREPEENQRVIVLYWPYNNHENEQVEGVAFYANGTFYLHEGDEMHPPSHWMPFPNVKRPASTEGEAP